ncbi:MAG: hypothetical protein ACOZQL_08085 [Myxococcota bacterium]
MDHQAPAQQVDERLTTLLAIEQRLESRFKEAEVEARARVEAARAEVERAREAGLREVEAQAAEEARADTVAHELALQRLEAERNAALTTLAAVQGERLDELARRAVARAVGGGTGSGGAS